MIPSRILVIALSWLPAVGLALAADSPAQALPRATGVIAFGSFAPRHWELHLSEPGGASRRLTASARLEYNAAFSPDGRHLAFVSEQEGSVDLYRRSIDGGDAVRLTTGREMDDHPAWSPDGSQIAFVSTRQSAPAGQAWTGIYLIGADGGEARRLSGSDAADYAPAWSPDGQWLAFASGKDRPGRIMIMRPDGSGRQLVIEDGSWPTFIESGAAIAFHRQADGNWGVWRVGRDGSGLKLLLDNASMPRATLDGTRIAYVNRAGGQHQISVLDLATGASTAITSDNTQHWNPAISPDGNRVVYHRDTPDQPVPNLQPWRAPDGGELSLLRVDGSFPAFSPDFRHLAFINMGFSAVEIMDFDGGGRRTLFRGKHRTIFGTTWADGPPQVVFSHGGVFAPAAFEVNVMAVPPAGGEPVTLNLSGSANDGFPSFSPDGREVVFRSGRDGAKNLYIANRGSGAVRRLTEGSWTDTMCDWSDTGEWIAFSSDRENNFEIWVVRPDGTGLRKLVGGGGRNTHPSFSPDGQWIVFTSQRAGWSADPISVPQQPQPYGELFMVRIDGTELTRLTHNGFEEGTPAWGAWPVTESTR